MSRIIRPTLLLSLALGLAGLGSCGLISGDPDPKKPDKQEGPMFDADYYSQQAKAYMDGRQYARAKKQWETLLSMQPGNFMGSVGLGMCDIFLADEAVATRSDTVTARELVVGADKRLREIWNGTVESDVTAADPRQPQWKAALGVAFAARKLGNLDQVEAARAADAARRGGNDAAKQAKTSSDLLQRRDRNYAAAIEIFRRLADMKFAAPDAIRNLAELYTVTNQDAAAEREYRRFLAQADTTQTLREDERKRIMAVPDEEERNALLAASEDSARANGAVQAGVLADLAALAWSRQDYVEGKNLLDRALVVAPDRTDLYLKIAQFESQLQMYETAKQHAGEFIARSARAREEFDGNVNLRRAYEIQRECDAKLAARAKK